MPSGYLDDFSGGSIRGHDAESLQLPAQQGQHDSVDVVQRVLGCAQGDAGCLDG